jgi:hypothetical protein
MKSHQRIVAGRARRHMNSGIGSLSINYNIKSRINSTVTQFTNNSYGG